MSAAGTAHLARRAARWAVDSIRGCGDESAATAVLSPAELELWRRLQHQDRAHALRVLSRFSGLRPSAPESEIRGVLLHDVGKSVAGLGLASRIAATVLGPRRARWRDYLDHERIGAGLLREAGSQEATWRLLLGEGDPEALQAFRRADDE